MDSYRSCDYVIDICILFETTDAPWGGGNQFLRSLAMELSRLGHRVTSQPTSDTQVVLLNAHNAGVNRHLDPGQIAQLRHSGKMTSLGRLLPAWSYMWRARKGPVLIHRVDGVAELVRGRRTRADEIQPAVNRLTDHTIFQTEYCRTSFAEHCGVVPASWHVITNGVDPQVFYPDLGANRNDGPFRLVAVSWSSNPRKGFATLADLSRLPGVELTFVGNWCPDVDPANVKLAGVMKSEELSEVMRSSDVMVHAAWNEPCSNAIVEAMACGLPVIFRDSGGNRELAGDYGIPLTDDLSDVLDSMRGHYVDLRERVLRDTDTFLIRRAAQEYLSMFRYAVANHERGWRF